MTFDPLLQPLREESRALAARCRTVQSHPVLAQLALRLGQVADAPPPRERPVIVALIGGTGAGKSHLFNALLGQPEASATSRAERLKTRHPHVARRPAEHALLPHFGDGEVTYLDAPTSWLALVDTPDIDGMREQHREITQGVIAAADIVIFVSNPEKRADFGILETVRDWAGRKRWFFVLNQVDRFAADLEAMREDFDRRLRELGFAPDDACRFLVSATEPAKWDFPRLRDTLLGERPREAAAALAVDALLGQTLHAANPATIERIEFLRAELGERERGLATLIVTRVREAIERRRLGHRLVPVLRKQLWLALPAQVGGPLALPVAVHARVSALTSAFQIWRLTTAGFSLWRLGLLATSLFSALRGSIEVRGLVMQVDGELAPELESMANDVRRFLEDRQLTLPVAAESRETALEQDLQQVASGIPAVGAPLARLLGQLTIGSSAGRLARELAPLFTEALEQRAEEAAPRCVGPVAKLLNVLPLAALVHICYELVDTWLRKEWLPGTFYLHAIAIFLLTLLPGYLLICFNVSRQLRRTATMEAILGAAGRLPPVGPAQALALLGADLETILAGLRSLRARGVSVRTAINAEFGVAELGVTTAVAQGSRERALVLPDLSPTGS